VDNEVPLSCYLCTIVANPPAIMGEDCTKGVAPETTETARRELSEAGLGYVDAAEMKKGVKWD
jgi:hypothetical protein